MKNLKATYRFFGSIHVLRHKDGRKYPFELLRDFRFVRNGYQRFVVPGRQEWPWWRRGFETDFGSIPGKNSLKRWLEPQDLVPCSEVDESIKHAVWVYDDGPNDKPILVGYFIDFVAIPALVHDWLYAARLVSCELANEIFFDLLKGFKVWSSWIMYKAVSLFGWIFYDGNPIEEIRQDRELGQVAMDRFFADVPDSKLHELSSYLAVPAG